jgi:EAL domain-containing protein (putative c-di-GMP-specific phosphodiesterase class I)
MSDATLGSGAGTTPGTGPRARSPVERRSVPERRVARPVAGPHVAGSRGAGPTDAQLVDALPGAGDRGEWELRYQPQVDAGTRRIESVEALLRWEHPRLGTVGPERFVAVAETTAVLGELTRWVIEEALDAQVRWRDVHLVLPVAVNLSAGLIGDLELLGWIGDQLRVRRLGPEVLTIEITETADMGDPDLAAPYLVALRAYGIRVSVDDFGTGYTSLTALTRLPLDELKIDQAFIRRSAASSADEAVIRSVGELGHRLGCKVVAEGVEDEATARRLTRLGVDVLQGFLFAPALSERALIPFVTAGRRALRQASGQLDL